MRTRALLAGVGLGLLLAGGSGCIVVGESQVPRPSGAEAPTPQDPPPGGSDAPAAQAMARDVFDRVNAERAARGLAPVQWSDELAGVAREWSQAMADRGVLEHQDPRELLQREELSGFQGVGENIFTASGPVTSGRIHAGWMRSKDHRGNVVNPGWNRLGVGIFCAPDGSVWATQEFGRTVGADRPPVSQETPPEEPIARPEDEGPTCG